MEMMENVSGTEGLLPRLPAALWAYIRAGLGAFPANEEDADAVRRHYERDADTLRERVECVHACFRAAATAWLLARADDRNAVECDMHANGLCRNVRAEALYKHRPADPQQLPKDCGADRARATLLARLESEAETAGAQIAHCVSGLQALGLLASLAHEESGALVQEVLRPSTQGTDLSPARSTFHRYEPALWMPSYPLPERLRPVAQALGESAPLLVLECGECDATPSDARLYLLALGDIGLGEWRAAEVQEEVRSRAGRLVMIGVALTIFFSVMNLCLGCLGKVGGAYVIERKRQLAEQRDAHAAYLAETADSPIRITLTDLRLDLGEGVRIAYGGVSKRDENKKEHDEIVLLLGKQTAPLHIRVLPVPGDKDAVYGDCDLEPIFGIMATMRVRRATEDRMEWIFQKNE